MLCNGPKQANLYHNFCHELAFLTASLRMRATSNTLIESDEAGDWYKGVRLLRSSVTSLGQFDPFSQSRHFGQKI